MKLEITRRELCAYFIMKEISHSDISGITTKAPCGVALMGERHVRIEISDFVMRTFVLLNWRNSSFAKKVKF